MEKQKVYHKIFTKSKTGHILHKTITILFGNQINFYTYHLIYKADLKDFSKDFTILKEFKNKILIVTRYGLKDTTFKKIIQNLFDNEILTIR